ncbi:hypothetical protein MSAN_01507300 [Mycena sanguinolenta]|uniref:Uncharacterized protein n=1 Tax=Mycena sanguinolenta TaxID=230812 RepID=A0A8H6Y7A2_9AGAR|nr:hypothetical protein MSAN_01507300 [Mycena sanguinolenta]
MDPQADSNEEFIVLSTSDCTESASYAGAVLPQISGLTNNAKLFVKSIGLLPSLLGARVTESQASGTARTHIRKYSETMGRQIVDQRSVTNYYINGGTGGSGGEGGDKGGDGGTGQGPTVYFGQPQAQELSDFQTIQLGDLKLVKEVCLSTQSGLVGRPSRGVGVRRIHHAKIRGDPGTVTVAMYQGDSAENLRLPLSETINAWLAQANHIFAKLQEQEHVENYVCVWDVLFQLRIAVECHISEGYLFVCPPQHFHTGTEAHANLYQWPACPAYWSLEPSGADRLSTEDAKNLGFPTIHIETTMYGHSWDRSIYTGLQQFHEGKGFDPESREVARHLGYPLYEVSSDRAPFPAHEDSKPEAPEPYSFDSDSEPEHPSCTDSEPKRPSHTDSNQNDITTLITVHSRADKWPATAVCVGDVTELYVRIDSGYTWMDLEGMQQQMCKIVFPGWTHTLESSTRPYFCL